MIERITEDPQNLNITVWLREEVTPALHDRIEAFIGDLNTLESQGKIHSTTVRIWGSNHHPGNRGATLQIEDSSQEVFRNIISWHENVEVELAPAFRTVQTRSFYCASPCELISVPVITLVIDDGSDILAVVPHCDQGKFVSVDEFFQSLMGQLHSKEIEDDSILTSA